MRGSVVLLALVLSLSWGSPAARGDDAAIDRLIGQLASVDPRVREQAGQSLIALGEQSRAPLRRAARSNDPAIAAAAGELLQRLPWTREADPPVVRELLGNFGQQWPDERQAVVEQLASLRSASALAALVRIAAYDTDPSVAWLVVQHLRTMPGRRARDALDALDEPEPSPTLQAARGWAWLRADPRKALRLFEQAVREFEGSDNAMVDDEMRRLMRLAADLADEADQPETASDLRRRRIELSELDDADSSGALAELLASHVHRGDRASLQDDLRRFASRLADPRVLYVLAEDAERRGSRRVARGMRVLADRTLPVSTIDPMTLGEFLFELGWNRPAQRVFSELVRRVETDDPILAANARLRLGRIAEIEKRYADAADLLEGAIESAPESVFTYTSRSGHVEVRSSDQMRGEVARLRLRDALTRNDAREVERRLGELAPLAHFESGLALETIVRLHERQRFDEARELFRRARRLLRERLRDAADDPDVLNEAAWLMARSGMAVEEALPLARRAIELAPDHAGYLDTLAEALFRLGQVEEAVRVEQRAVELRPDDPFLARQVQRFRTTPPDRNPLPSD